jgi:hypothetical protein
MEQIMRINADDASLYLLFIQIKPPFKCVCPDILSPNLLPNPNTLYLVPCTLYPVPCTLYPVRCTLYAVRCTLYSVLNT